MITTPDGIPLHKHWYEIHTTSGMGANRVDHITWVTKEWAKLFLTNWNRAVSVWNNGELFTDKEWPSKSVSQQYYAKLCCSWIIPNGMVEPHCVAEGG